MNSEINFAAIDQEHAAISQWIEMIATNTRKVRVDNPDLNAGAVAIEIAAAITLATQANHDRDTLIVYLATAIEIMTRPKIDLPSLD